MTNDREKYTSNRPSASAIAASFRAEEVVVSSFPPQFARGWLTAGNIVLSTFERLPGATREVMPRIAELAERDDFFVWLREDGEAMDVLFSSMAWFFACAQPPAGFDPEVENGGEAVLRATDDWLQAYVSFGLPAGDVGAASQMRSAESEFLCFSSRDPSAMAQKFIFLMLNEDLKWKIRMDPEKIRLLLSSVLEWEGGAV